MPIIVSDHSVSLPYLLLITWTRWLSSINTKLEDTNSNVGRVERERVSELVSSSVRLSDSPDPGNERWVNTQDSVRWGPGLEDPDLDKCHTRSWWFWLLFRSVCPIYIIINGINLLLCLFVKHDSCKSQNKTRKLKNSKQTDELMIDYGCILLRWVTLYSSCHHSLNILHLCFYHIGNSRSPLWKI